LGVTPAAIILGVIIALAAFLRLYNIHAIGDANTYYTAAVESMLQSWHNFFFVAAEPGGSVTVDKPPLGLWIEAISAFFLGVNGFAVVLPNILAGLLSIPLLYHLVKKYYGTGAGLLAGLVVAVTPVAIAAERNNTMDGMLTFFLILAAWGFINATETGKRRYLWAGAALVALAFNIKMLQAFLPLPAFYALYFFGAKVTWREKVINLMMATVILFALSLSWAIVVDLTPADERPYIGSSTNNTVIELMTGHNGINRLVGGGPPGGGPPPGGGSPPGGAPADGAPADGNGGAGAANQPRPGPPGGGPPGGGPPGGGPGREVGSAAPLRFLRAPLSKEMSWLLPFALFSMLLALGRKRPTFPLSAHQKGLILWGGWLMTCLVFFSIASFFHAYYMIMLAPALAAMVASGAAILWQMSKKTPQRAAILLLMAALLTQGYQLFNMRQFTLQTPWLPLTLGLFLLGIGLLLPLFASGHPKALSPPSGAGDKAMGHPLAHSPTRPLTPSPPRPRAPSPPRRSAAFSVIMLSLMVTPFAWSTLTMLEEAPHVGLPSAYAGEREANGLPPGGEPRANQELLDYLTERTQDVSYLMAAPSALIGSPYVLATKRPVLYMGGFNGSDQVLSTEDMAHLIETKQLRYVLTVDRVGPPGGEASQEEIKAWLSSTCTVVEEIELSNDMPGLGPPPPPPAQGAGGDGRPEASPPQLYECGS
jgi:4-amino-4-deoxy-L-arabinose transferase-like glycosyltransferase